MPFVTRKRQPAYVHVTQAASVPAPVVRVSHTPRQRKPIEVHPDITSNPIHPGTASPTRALQAAAGAPCVRERKPGTPVVFEYPECWSRPVNWWAFDGRRTLGK